MKKKRKLMSPQCDSNRTRWHLKARWTFNLNLFSVISFKGREAAFPFRVILDDSLTRTLKGFRREHSFRAEVRGVGEHFFWLIRPSGEGCPCQEGGQGTNSFLFRDTSIYQA